MANLKGSTFEKQIKNALMRMERFGSGRHNTDSKNIHSGAVFEKRKMYLKDFASFAKRNNLEGKLNSIMTNENISSFLSERLNGLKSSTIENYSRSFSAMVDSLRDNNINVNLDKKVFDDVVIQAKREDTGVFKTNRSIDDKNEIIKNLYNKHYSSGVIAEVQLTLGYRVSEAEDVVYNLNRYLNEDSRELTGVIGKGGQEYTPKTISHELIEKIRLINHKYSHSTYMNDLKEQWISSHDFRYTFALDLYNQLTRNGESENEALKIVSKELNHHRSEITKYYLKRA